MKVAPKLIFAFNGSDGVASSIAAALRPSPNSSLRRLEEPFELSLDGYGIKDSSARGDLVHFVDGGGVYKVSLITMQAHTPPTLACAIYEVLAHIQCEAESLPILLIPSIESPSKIKCETRAAGKSRKAPIYCFPVGPETNIPGSIFSKTEKAPLPLQFLDEALACFLHFVRVLKWPAIFIFGIRGRSSLNKKSGEELEMLVEMGDILANTTGLSFSRDRISFTPGKTLRDNAEPWRALYG